MKAKVLTLIGIAILSFLSSYIFGIAGIIGGIVFLVIGLRLRKRNFLKNWEKALLIFVGGLFLLSIYLNYWTESFVSEKLESLAHNSSKESVECVPNWIRLPTRNRIIQIEGHNYDLSDCQFVCSYYFKTTSYKIERMEGGGWYCYCDLNNCQ